MVPDPHQRSGGEQAGQRSTGTATTAPITTAAAPPTPAGSPPGRWPGSPPSTQARSTTTAPPTAPTAVRAVGPPGGAGRRIHAGRPAPTGQQGEHAGQGRAHQHRLGVGVGAEVDAGSCWRRGGRGRPSPPPRPPPRPPTRRQHPRTPRRNGSRQVEHGQHHERPHQVELLLHGERPGVGERGHGAGGDEVVAAGGDLPPVRDVEQGRERRPTGTRVGAGGLGEADHQGRRPRGRGAGRAAGGGPAGARRHRVRSARAARTRPAAVR